MGGRGGQGGEGRGYWMATLTPEAKAQLSKTVRGLRARLLTDLRAAADGVYRLSVPVSKAGLAEKERILRRRLEDWLDEQARADRGKKESLGEARERHRLAAEKLAGATLLNRLVVIKHMEALGTAHGPAVVTGGWGSPGYRQFSEFAPALVAGGEAEGYATLLRLLFDELAVDLPGLFGEVGTGALLPVPAATLRAVVEALDDPALDSAWTDDTTLGWVYQYWNDPEREALDAKLHAGGKVEPHEIASKTQMFTERYMVEWLLHNSLGQMWLATCRKHGWTPEVEADGTVDRLEERRKAWRAKREAGEVALDELMPIETEMEERWKYWVPQPMPDDAVAHAPESVRQLEILDPACGSGHFLVIAFDLLVALYREEARHRGEEWRDREIVESIVENNLHGIDIDPWAVQIAAAALFLKARQACREARPRHMNLVASNLRLASLADDDPALVELRREILTATGIPESLTDEIIHALKGADHLGSLLKVDAAVETAIQEHEEAAQIGLFDAPAGKPSPGLGPESTRRTLLDRLEDFLARHGSADDLGLRLRGEQLATGVRFMRMVEEGKYDLVVGNPPYQGTSKMAEGGYVKKHYPRGKTDLFAAFLERGLQLAREGGVSALLTMRNWMFIKRYADLRQRLLSSYDLRALGDFAIGALDATDHRDSLGHRAADLIHTAWSEHGPTIDAKTDLRTWLRLKFFEGVHRKMYQNRPIHFPLSSRDRGFVAYVSIHRWTDATLQTLLADHLRPTQGRLAGEIADLLEARNAGDRKSRAKAEQRYGEVKRLHEELKDFIAKVAECAERGAPPEGAGTPAREVDARFQMDLDDGVMINSAGLWPLLQPQWKDPKKWWRELCLAKGRKDYDWCHLAGRYFPTRVDEKCRQDPSLAVAHGCFWQYHPAKAYQWQLRLQDEIAPDFQLDEQDSGALCAAFERDHPDQVEELVAAEHKRRERNRKKKAREEAKKAEAEPPTVAGPLFAS